MKVRPRVRWWVDEAPALPQAASVANASASSVPSAAARRRKGRESCFGVIDLHGLQVRIAALDQTGKAVVDGGEQRQHEERGEGARAVKLIEELPEELAKTLGLAGGADNELSDDCAGDRERQAGAQPGEHAWQDEGRF